MRLLTALLFSFLIASLTACGDEDVTAETASGEPGVSVPGEPSGGPKALTFACTSSRTVAHGRNNGWMVDGQTRDFYARLPTVDPSVPVSVIFMWHGVGDNAQNFHNFLSAEPDGDPEFPFIAIYPQGLQLQPISMGSSSKAGMEWDIFVGARDIPNLEASLFEEILGCLDKQYTLDGSRIYAAGFSGGAIVANMMHSRYPENIGALYAMSGAWFNDPVQVSGVKTGPFPIQFNWDALSSADTGAAIISHGGSADWYGSSGYAQFIPPDGKIIDFEQSALQALDFLKANNRTVIDCAHQNGHQPHPEVYTSTILEFFKAHRAGEKSPYDSDGLSGSFPAACRLH